LKFPWEIKQLHNVRIFISLAETKTYIFSHYLAKSKQTDDRKTNIQAERQKTDSYIETPMDRPTET